jgi:hypothetical protein
LFEPLRPYARTLRLAGHHADGQEYDHKLAMRPRATRVIVSTNSGLLSDLSHISHSPFGNSKGVCVGRTTRVDGVYMPDLGTVSSWPGLRFLVMHVRQEWCGRGA